jgi:hypothetical protein
MKTMFLAAAATLLLAGGAASAQASGSHTQDVQAPGAVVAATGGRSSQTLSSLRTENPTGLPSYEMRRDGLMINGLLPANGWQG